MNYDRLKVAVDVRLAQLADHQLTTLCETDKVSVYRLHRAGTRTMSVQVAFTPEGISIMGDFVPGGGNGVNSDLGYGRDWFSKHLGVDYLAEKFLKRRWTATAARDHIECWIADAEERVAELIAEKEADNTELAAAQSRLDDMREALADAGNGEFADSTAYDHHFARLFPEDSDTETVYPDWDYDEQEASDLAAIHQTFVRLWAARPAEGAEKP